MSRHLPAGVFLRRKPTLEESVLLSTLVKFNLCSMLPSDWNKTNCKKNEGDIESFLLSHLYLLAHVLCVPCFVVEQDVAV